MFKKLLQLCDQKLDKWSKFFALEDELPTATAEIHDAMPNREPKLEKAANMPETPQLSVSGEALNVASRPAIAAASITPSISVAPPDIAHNAQTNTTEQPAASNPSPERTNEFAAKMCDERVDDYQLQALERYIDNVMSTKSALAAFQEELRQSMAAATQHSERQLQENRDNIEITLKSVFKKLTDRLSAWETGNNRNIDLMQQIIETNRQCLTETAGKLNELAVQVGQLNENLRRLMDTFEDYKTQTNIVSLKAPLESPEPQLRRKSWFGKK